jgi:hypothetical protein
MSMKTCQNDFCHGTTGTMAGLLLTPEVLTQNYKAALLDQPNKGTMGVVDAGNPAGCPPAFAKLIDSSAPEKSLIYSKLGMPQPCGGGMPIIGTFTAEDKACVFRWINSVIAAGGGPRY